jgi:regulator of cell morphogenesis and NO signaling
MTDQLDMAVGEVAIRSPGANRVFWRHGIAYGSWGQRTVRESCQRLGIDPLQVTHDIDSITDPLAIRWQAVATPDLIRVMQVRYHQPLLGELDRLTDRARQTAISDQGRHPALKSIAPLVARLAIELERRISYEEQILFPAILAETTNCVPLQETSTDEQGFPGRLLEEIRILTNNYAVQEEEGVDIRSLFLGLQMLDMDIQEHLHVEDHLLFPRTRSLRRS